MNRFAAIGPILVVGGLVSGCAEGEKREFLDPELPKNPSIVTRVIVAAPGTQIETGQLLRFQAYGRTAAGDSVPVSVSWAATGGTINNDGYFIADYPGGYHIKASLAARPEVADSVALDVRRPPRKLVALVVDPAPVSLSEGDTMPFVALGYYDDGTVAAEIVDWSTTGGQISQNGVYIAPAAEGEFEVSARVVRENGNQVGSTKVYVHPRIKQNIGFEIAPASASLEAGENVIFEPIAHWKDGSTTTPAVNWIVTGGSMDAGRYTAGSIPGTYRVIAELLGTSQADTAIVTVGLPPITSVTITPGSATVAPGATTRFVATGHDGNGTRAVTVNWSASGGSIDADGNYVAPSSGGTYRVIARLAGGIPADTAIVTVNGGAPTLVAFSVSPGAASVPAGGTAAFTASAQWSDGSTAQPPVAWSATGGTISPAGVYTAGSATGTFRVIGRHTASGRADTSTVSVTAPAIIALEIAPDAPIVNTGGTQAFTLTARYSTGATGPLTTAAWTATGGTISSGGVYTAGGTPGGYRVIASAGGVADTMPVTVQSVAAPTLLSVAVTPGNVTLLPGGTASFAALATWSNGTSGAANVIWTATGGSVSSTGVYSAGQNSGSYRVIARISGGTKADTAVVTIAAPTLVSLSVSPPSLSVSAGGTQQFVAAGVRSDGSSASPAVSWHATGGTVSSAGFYTAGSVAGTYRVVAQELGGSLADTAIVTISQAAPTLTSVAVAPASASVVTGQSKQFSVSGTLSNGSSVTPAVTWSATGGSVSASGLYTAGGTPGTYRVVAVVQGAAIADTAIVSVSAPAAPTLAGLALTPSGISLPTGGSVQFSAAAQMSDGSSNPVSPTYTATGGSITTAGKYTAGGSTGNFRVIAAYQGKADTAVVIITPQAAYTTVYGDDFRNYASDAAVRSAYTGNPVHELWSFTSVPWAKTGLVSDNVFGKALKTVHEQQVPFYDLAGHPAGLPGATTRMRVVFNQGMMSHVWVRFFVKFSAPASNPLGFRTKSPNDPSPYGGSYKVFFLHWPAPYYERGSLVYTNTQRLDAELYVKNLPKVSEAALAGSGKSQNLTGGGGSEFTNNEWYEMIYLYQKTGALSMRGGGWVRQYTVGGQVNPQPYHWWASDNFYSGPTPLAESMELGGNKNHGNEYEQWVIWGPWEVVDGTRFYNPWGVPGI